MMMIAPMSSTIAKPRRNARSDGCDPTAGDGEHADGEAMSVATGIAHPRGAVPAAIAR